MSRLKPNAIGHCKLISSMAAGRCASSANQIPSEDQGEILDIRCGLAHSGPRHCQKGAAIAIEHLHARLAVAGFLAPIVILPMQRPGLGNA